RRALSRSGPRARRRGSRRPRRAPPRRAADGAPRGRSSRRSRGSRRLGLRSRGTFDAPNLEGAEDGKAASENAPNAASRKGFRQAVGAPERDLCWLASAMPLKLIHGPPNSGRADRVQALFREALDRDPVLVLPTLDDVFRFERSLCEGG